MAVRKLRRSRRPLYDPALGDQALTESCQDMAMGRWEGARDLLASGRRDDWDRRSHRVRLLADAAAGRRTVDVWRASEPGNPDAAVLGAETEVMRAFAAARGGATPDQAALDRVARICLSATELAPDDPQPWCSLITLARLYPSGHPHVWHWWQELQRRDSTHRDGHHQVLRFLSARWHGSHGAAGNFAYDTAAHAPAGSPLVVLPIVARAEHYRHWIETEGDTALGLSYHWHGQRALWDLRTAVEKWVDMPGTPGAQDVADLNHLAHGLVHADLTEDAARVFTLLDNRATRVPWSYTGDPERLFANWRDQVLQRG